MTEAQASQGMFGSVRRQGGTLLESVELRLEVIGTEVEREKLRIARGLLLTALGLLFASAALLLLSAAVVLVVSPAQRLPALIVLGGARRLAAARRARGIARVERRGLCPQPCRVAARPRGTAPTRAMTPPRPGRDTELALRQQLLVRRSDELRAGLAAECLPWRNQMSRLQRALACLRSHPEWPAGVVLAAVALRPGRALRWGLRLWGGRRPWRQLSPLLDAASPPRR